MTTKTAVDSSAKTYWELLFGSYGTELCRDIPRRIKAALLANKKIANIDDASDIRPVASAKDENGTVLEGLYRDQSAKLLFRAMLDNEGNVKEIKTIEIK